MTIVAIEEGKGLRLEYLFDTGKKVKTVSKRVSFSKPIVKSIAKEYPHAELYEREIMEQFDITFEGNPNPKPLFLMPENRGEYRRTEDGGEAEGV